MGALRSARSLAWSSWPRAVALRWPRLAPGERLRLYLSWRNGRTGEAGMWVLVLVVAGVLVLGWLLLRVRPEISNRGSVDRLRRRDQNAAARIEALRAEQAIRGYGTRGGSFTGGFGGN